MQKLLFLSTLCLLVLAGNVTAQEVEQGIDKIFKNYIDSGFSGAAIIIKDDKVILQKAYGYANNEKKEPITTKTLFNVASIGKQFTAVIVLTLEEKGLLNTRDYIHKYVGKLGGLKDSATVEHLLMHTSGLFVDGTQLNYDSREKFLASVRNTPLESKPGEKHRYSNAGYTLLAAIVEIVTKKPFEDVLHEMIFKPAGMKYTGYPWEKRIQKDLMATGYNSKDEAQPAETNLWGNRGPGNLVTNTDDMHKWYSAWSGSSLITEKIKERMFTDRIPGKETFSWNKITGPSGKKLYSKGGGRPDFESQIMWWPEEKVFLFFSINKDKNLRRLIFRNINSLMNNAR
ncbi:MAG: serine hydrolase domain-containing protein [Chitinophagaceae bacterium]